MCVRMGLRLGKTTPLNLDKSVKYAVTPLTTNDKTAIAEATISLVVIYNPKIGRAEYS